VVTDEEEIGEIPEDHRPVITSGGQGVPIRGESHPIDGAGVLGQRLTDLLRPRHIANIPQNYCPVSG
jgi:hypothetical protein